ncbi:MAG: TonB-dependent receptor [Dysgonamonadaceae bacterium]|jgi:TonB-linked SusC/RagA family outer membrane protein|nr:TonB-dependent receptor [Dysgonamonadaceae bacterium]
MNHIKSISIYLLICFLAIASSTVAFAQISVSANKQKIKQVIYQIEKNSNYSFFYSDEQLDLEREINIDVTNESIEFILDKLFKGTNITYTIDGDGQILLTVEKQERNQEPVPAKKYSGVVIDEKGEAIIGASIGIKGGKTGTVTDVDGKFLISAPVGSTLSVSYIGFASKEIKLRNDTELQIVISEDDQLLDEVVVVGYGVQLKRDVTTAIASIKASELAVPVTSIDQAITGRLAGVQVLQPNGIPGGTMAIKVRGNGSINAGNEPLYVIDGFPVSDGAGNATGMKVNPLSSININDIESVEVLKDASSAAIYGSRGANGVVIITTKRGKESKPVVQYDGYYGWQKTTRKIEMMNAYQQAEILYEARNTTYLEALSAAGITGSITDTNDERRQRLGQPLTSTKLNYLIPDHIFPYLNGEPGLTNTDWQDEVLRTAPMQSHNISINGGSPLTQYFLSVNYREEEGIVLGSGFNQLGARAKVDAQYDRFAFGANVSFNHSDYDLVPTEDRYSNETILSTALGMLPSFPVYNGDGSYNFDQHTLDCGIPNLINPVALALERKDNMQRNRMLGNMYAEYEWIKDLKLKTSLGADYNTFRRNIFRPSTLPTSINLIPPSVPTGESRTKDVLNWVWENTLSYLHILDKHHTLSFVAGWMAQKEFIDNSRLTATGYPNDLIETLNASTLATYWDTTRQQWSLLSVLARAQYSYKNKYLLSAAIRSDGSSRFGSNNRWGSFPSISGGWYVTEEDFMANQRQWLSALKLRASYGISGNFSIGNYEYYSTIGDDNYVLGATETIAGGLVPTSAGNPDLGWEKTAMTNIGLEIGLFNQMNIEVDVYHSITSDMLLNVPVPEFSGFSTVLKNIGKLSNRGVEISLSNRNKWRHFTWNNRLNFSVNRNKVLDLGGVDELFSKGETMDFITRVGEPIGNYYAYVIDGVFMNQEEISIANDPNDDRIAKVTNAHPGDFKFVDVHKDGVIDSQDKTIAGNYLPDFTYGFSTEFQYQWFDLSMALQGIYGNEIANINRRYLNNMEGGSGQIDALNRWKSEENPGNGQVNRANRSATGMNSQMSTWHIEDGSYLRIRNITFGMTMPQEWTKQAGISRIRLYFSSQNPFTFTRYSGYNPEVDMKGNTLTPGIDYGTYPLAKSAVIGLNLIF